MREFLKITAGGLIVALAVTPALAQTGTMPKQEQQAPRNQGGMSQPGTSGTGTSDTTIYPGNTNTSPGQLQNRDAHDSQSKGALRGSPPGTGTTSRDNAFDGVSGKKAGKANVRQVQEALKAQGHDPGPVDGVMGPQTQEALRAYQRSENLTETGRLDQQTSEKLGVGASMGQQPSR